MVVSEVRLGSGRLLASRGNRDLFLVPSLTVGCLVVSEGRTSGSQLGQLDEARELELACGYRLDSEERTNPLSRSASGPVSVPAFGALMDKATKIRSLGEVKRRSGWKQDKSWVQRSATPNDVDRARRRLRDTTRGYFDPWADSCASRKLWQDAVASGCFVAVEREA